MGEEAEDAHYARVAEFNGHPVAREEVRVLAEVLDASTRSRLEQMAAEEKRERKRAARLAGKR